MERSNPSVSAAVLAALMDVREQRAAGDVVRRIGNFVIDVTADRVCLTRSETEPYAWLSCRHKKARAFARAFSGLLLLRQADFTPSVGSGRARKTCLVPDISALATAGATGGVPGSPIPVGFSFDGTICTSTCGISWMRSTS
jgi:hypothetical protein